MAPVHGVHRDLIGPAAPADHLSFILVELTSMAVDRRSAVDVDVDGDDDG